MSYLQLKVAGSCIHVVTFIVINFWCGVAADTPHNLVCCVLGMNQMLSGTC